MKFLGLKKGFGSGATVLDAPAPRVRNTDTPAIAEERQRLLQVGAEMMKAVENFRAEGRAAIAGQLPPPDQSQQDFQRLIVRALEQLAGDD